MMNLIFFMQISGLSTTKKNRVTILVFLLYVEGIEIPETNLMQEFSSLKETRGQNCK